MAEVAETILADVEDVFGTAVRPETIFDVKDRPFRDRFKKEFDHLEAFDWEHETPEKLLEIYEPNTFLSDAGFKYLLPKVFKYCLQWREAAIKTDFVYAYFLRPFFRLERGILADFTEAEGRALWHVIEYMNKELDFDSVDEEELKSLKAFLLRQ
jgi:hypothetical protein